MNVMFRLKTKFLAKMEIFIAKKILSLYSWSVQGVIKKFWTIVALGWENFGIKIVLDAHCAIRQFYVRRTELYNFDFLEN